MSIPCLSHCGFMGVNVVKYFSVIPESLLAAWQPHADIEQKRK